MITSFSNIEVFLFLSKIIFLDSIKIFSANKILPEDNKNKKKNILNLFFIYL